MDEHKKLKEECWICDPNQLTKPNGWTPPPMHHVTVYRHLEAERKRTEDMIATAELRSRMRHPSYIPASERMAMWNREHEAL